MVRTFLMSVIYHGFKTSYTSRVFSVGFVEGLNVITVLNVIKS